MSLANMPANNTTDKSYKLGSTKGGSVMQSSDGSGVSGTSQPSGGSKANLPAQNGGHSNNQVVMGSTKHKVGCPATVNCDC